MGNIIQYRAIILTVRFRGGSGALFKSFCTNSINSSKKVCHEIYKIIDYECSD